MICPVRVERLRGDFDASLESPPVYRAEYEKRVSHRFGGPICLCSPSDDDEFAPVTGEKVCRDRNGRWRLFHSWDKDGVCIFCDERRG